MTDAEFDEPNVRAEPIPNWDTATETWDWAWELHTYGIGLGFLLLGLYCVYTSHLLFKHNKGKLKPFFITINMLVFLLCFLRTVFLIVDPYRSREIFSELVAQILFNIPFPCLTSGFSLVNWAFLESSKFKLLSPKLQNARILIAIIIAHFTFVLTVDFIVAYVADTWVLVMLCQGAFILWALILCIGFSISAWRVYHIKSKVRTNIYRVSKTSHGVTGRFKLRKSRDRQKSRNERPDHSNVSSGIMTNPDTEPRRFSLTGTNENIPQTYDCLKEDSYNESHNQQQQQSEKSVKETNETHGITTLQIQKENMTDAEVIKSYVNNDIVVKTDLDPNNIVDANGTLYALKARHDSEHSHDNEAFGFGEEPFINTDTPSGINSPDSCQSKESADIIHCNQSNYSEMDLVSLAVSAEPMSNGNSNENVYRNTISKRASMFLMSIKGNRLLRKKQYGVKPVRKLSVNKNTSVTTKMMRITLITTVFAAIICLVSTYAMFGVFSVLADEKELEPWGWYAFQTVMRLCELGMGVTMAYFTTTPPKTKTNLQQQSGRQY